MEKLIFRISDYLKLKREGRRGESIIAGTEDKGEVFMGHKNNVTELEGIKMAA